MVFKYWFDTNKLIWLFHRRLLVKPVVNNDSAKFLQSDKQISQSPLNTTNFALACRRCNVILKFHVASLAHDLQHGQA